jgi:uncharacterized protein YbaA (DUF1428 family)
MAAKAAKIWRKYDTLEFRECAGDDLKTTRFRSFLDPVKPKRGGTVVFAWIVSRAHRDRVNDKVMKDPQIARMIQGKKMTFDSKRMAGGFNVTVDASRLAPLALDVVPVSHRLV